MTVSVATAQSLEPTLVELVKIRASQINACANCVLTCTRPKRASESEQRIYLLSAWREAHRPRTRGARLDRRAHATVGGDAAHEAAYAALNDHFSQEEQVKLTLMINVINGWNRLAVGFGLWIEPADAKAAAADGGLMPNLDPANGSAEARADAAASFDPLRRTLIRVAYRMLGSVADAEDMVQEAFIRWMDVDRTECACLKRSCAAW